MRHTISDLSPEHRTAECRLCPGLRRRPAAFVASSCDELFEPRAEISRPSTQPATQLASVQSSVLWLTTEIKFVTEEIGSDYDCFEALGVSLA